MESLHLSSDNSCRSVGAESANELGELSRWLCHDDSSNRNNDDDDDYDDDDDDDDDDPRNDYDGDCEMNVLARHTYGVETLNLN